MQARLLLLALLAPLVISCATLRPIPPEERDAFFTCRGVTLEQAEINLAEHSFVPKEAGKASLSTEVTEVFLEKTQARVWVPEATTERLVDIHERVRVRILVYQLGVDAVRFKPFWGHRSDVLTYRSKLMFPVAERLYYQQVEDAQTYGLLSQMREAVCGSAAPIAKPWGG